MIDGPFKVTGGFFGEEVSVCVGRGTVNGYEPRVAGRRIGGIDDTGKLNLDIPNIVGQKVFDAYGRLYVCLQVQIDPSTGFMIPSSLTVVISPRTRYGAEENNGLKQSVYWNHPIAVFSDNGNLGQIAYFNYMHYTARKQQSASQSIWFQYFCAI